MLGSVFLSVFLGVLIGIFAGLFPGVHTNLIAVTVALLNWDVDFVVPFLVAVAVSRSVIDAVPSVFLGASDADNVLALSPSNKLLRRGFGAEAVKFLVSGSVMGVVGCLVLVPVLVVVLPVAFEVVKPFLFWILLVLVLFLVLRDGWCAVVVFSFSGVLGLLVFSGVREPLFPLLSGLFGASGLFLSILRRTMIPVQYESEIIGLRPASLFVSAFFGVFSGAVVTLFPGLGPSQAAALVQMKRLRGARFLVLIGALGTVDVIISLVTFFTLGKARNGAIVVVEQLVGSFSLQTLVALFGVACCAAGVSAFVALWVSKYYARVFDHVEYVWVCVVVLVLLAVLSGVFSGWLGLLTFGTALSVGVLAPLLGVARSHAMGCLLVPTLVWLW